jgi:hypothetical protein
MNNGLSGGVTNFVASVLVLEIITCKWGGGQKLDEIMHGLPVPIRSIFTSYNYFK